MDCRATLPTSIEEERLFKSLFVMPETSGADEVELAQCCDKIDLLSSIGVNILRDLDVLLTGCKVCCGCCCGAGIDWSCLIGAGSAVCWC